jgi:NAD(P)-dependent dehydrogenase (short-subunit alcohol dehydrogenase family)
LPPPPDLFDLSGQVAIVTGGSRGLGLEMAEGLGEADAKFVISARRAPDLKRPRRTRAKWVSTCSPSRARLGRRSRGMERLVSATRETFGRTDIVVNSAAVSWAAPTLDRWQMATHMAEHNILVNASA